MNSKLTDEMVTQLERIRSDGRHNMFDLHGVQYEAHRLGFHSLVIYLEEHRDEYVRYIFTGKRE